MSALPLISLALVALCAPHPDSLSSSRVTVAGREAHVTLRCQVLSFLEVLPELDANGDGEVTPEEVDERSAALLEYATSHYRLYSGTDRDGEGGTRLAALGGEVHFVAPESGAGLAQRGGAIDLEFRCRGEQPIEDLVLEVELFRETSPGHIDLATVVWPGGVTSSFGLDARTPRARSSPGNEGAFAAFLSLGFEHILGGWDHIAFLFALLLSSRRLRSVLAWVTAFTLAHSISLALATLGIVDVSGWSRLVESAIALSIAYVAADNLLRPELRRGRWLEAFGFGLLHGLGFAGFLSRSLVLERSKALALFSFNLGVELGQLVIVAALCAPFFLWWKRHATAPEFLMPRWLRRGGSALVCGLGLYWFFLRL